MREEMQRGGGKEEKRCREKGRRGEDAKEYGKRR
jgi:hypothetical protein